MSWMYGLSLLASSGINAWQAGKNRQSSERISALNRDSSEEVARLSRKHSAELQYNQIRFSVLQQRENQDFQRELAELSHERLKEIEVFRAEVNFAINQKNLDFQKWRFEEEKKIQFEILQLQQDFQRDLSNIQHQNALIQMRERMRTDKSPINNLACDLLENSFSHGIMPLKVFIAPPILDYDPITGKHNDSYESFLAKEIEQFLHQGYLNSKQYPVQLLDGSWVSKKQSGGSALQSIHAQLKSIPVLVLESKIPLDEINLGLGYWNSGDTSYTQSLILSGESFTGLLYSSAKKRALEWEVTRKKLEALGKDEVYIKTMGGVNEENLQIYHKELAEKTELEQHGIDTSNLPVSKQYRITEPDYKSFYQYLAVYHCLAIGLYADILFLGNSWENTPLLPSLIPYLIEKYKNHFLLIPQFWQEAISKFVTAYGQFYDILKSDASNCLPEIRMKLALSLANLPNEYKYLALKQCDQAVSDWLVANNAPSDKVFDMDSDEDLNLLKGIFYQEDKPFFDSVKQLLAIVNEAENIDLTKVKRINSLLEDWKRVSSYGNISDFREIEKVIAYYNQAINLNPNNADAYFNRGNAYDDLKEYEKAIADYTQAINLNPNYDYAYNNRGNAYDDLEEYEKAIADYTQAINLNPNYDYAYVNRGNAYANLKEYEKATADYNQAIKLNPNYVDDYNNRGLAYYYSKEYEKAIFYYNQAINLNSNYAEAYNNRGLAYHWLKEYEKAVADYNQAIYLNPNYAEAYCNRGNAKFGMPDGDENGYENGYKKTFADYNHAINLNPNYAGAYYSRGFVYYCLDEYKKAIADFTQAINLNPDAHTYEQRGDSYKYLKEYEKAIADYTQVIILNPNPERASFYYYIRGDMYEELKEYERAIADFTQAINLNPNDAYYYSRRGDVDKLLGNTQNALSDYRQAFTLYQQQEGDTTWSKHLKHQIEYLEDEL